MLYIDLDIKYVYLNDKCNSGAPTDHLSILSDHSSGDSWTDTRQIDTGIKYLLKS